MEDFFVVHGAVEFLRRQCISEYWDELREDDIVAALSPRQKNHLFTIKRLGPCSLHSIMLHTGLSSSAASAAVDKLVRLGVVERERNSENRREIVVRVTPGLEEHFRRIEDKFRERVSSLLSECETGELEAVRGGMAVLRRRFRDYEF